MLQRQRFPQALQIPRFNGFRKAVGPICLSHGKLALLEGGPELHSGGSGALQADGADRSRHAGWSSSGILWEGKEKAFKGFLKIASV